MMFKCEDCGAEFPKKSSLQNHKASHKEPMKCQSCDYSTRRKPDFNRHLKTHQRKRAASTDAEDVAGKRQHIDSVEPNEKPAVFGKPLPVPDDLPHPEITHHYETKIVKDKQHELGPRFVDFQLTFEDVPTASIEEQLSILRMVLENIIHALISGLPKQDKVRFVMRAPQFHKPISVPWLPVQEASVDVWMDVIKRVLQSADEFFIDNGVSMNFIHQALPEPASGFNRLGAPTRRKIIDKNKYHCAKRSIISIKNTDKLCVARALMVGKKLADGQYLPDYYRSAQLTKDARNLHAVCNISEGPCDLATIQLFMDHPYFENYMLNIFDASRCYKRILNSEANEKLINLLLDEGHCNVITSIPGFFNTSCWCKQCGKCYDHEPHKCLLGCPHCKFNGCENRVRQSGAPRHCCDKCQTLLMTNACLKIHEDKGLCKGKKRCLKCGRLLPEKNFDEAGNHPNCGMKYCRTCHKHVDPNNHPFCFIQPYQKKQDKQEDIIDLIGGNEEEEDEEYWNKLEADEETREAKKPQIYYWDSETEFADDGVHKVTLIIVQKDNGEEFEFYGDSAVGDFMNWLFNEKANGPRILIAHNFKGFDSYPILKYCMENSLEVSPIFQGQKLLQLTYKPKKLVFRDSACFLPFKLEDFSKAFSLPIIKTYFPYWLNVKRNRAYKKAGALPDQEFYNPKMMTRKARRQFEAWWKSENARLAATGDTWEMAKVLKEYCRNDVTLLRLGCEQYRKALIDKNGIDPMVQAITGAAATHLAFRKNHLKEDSIVVVSDHGLQPETHYSNLACLWLAYIMRLENIEIQCALNGKERKAGKYRLDGYVYADHPLASLDGAQGMVALEFNGCLFHGHKCQDRNKLEPFSGETMKQRYMRTMERKQNLEQEDITVVQMWECEFRKQLTENEDLSRFAASMNPMSPPLKPRDGFFGGRTNAARLLYTAGENEEILYYDFTSLYPFINCYREYPVGAPEIIKHNFKDIQEYFGICQVTVLPPRGLYMPVLPSRTKNGKLIFTLCAKCAEEEAKSPYCNHTDEERALKNQVYCTPELLKAVDKGYKLLAIHEIWHWKDRSDQLFRDFLLDWMKVKVHNSGYPDNCDSQEAKKAFVDHQNEIYGWDLDTTDIVKNATMRTLAKQMLNQFWGRFGMKTNKDQCVLTVSQEEYLKIFTNESLVLGDVIPVSDKMLMVTYTYEEDLTPIQGNLSLVVALFTTCWARLHLYTEALEKLDKSQILYYDTDSVIWVSKPGFPTLSTGEKLGDFKDEILDEYGSGASIKTFGSSGPKSYAYCIQMPDGAIATTSKAKGVAKTGISEEILTPEVMLEAITALDGRKIEIPVPDKINRKKDTGLLFNRTEKKTWQVIYTKRVLIDEYKTCPFGYYEGV